ncbi:unnamed protein product (macronuclear) [Paramecium tetraurelia]|uniref:Calcium-dependent protein kinase 1 n=1 Tax=Paramecium tetraurelia TaxID=5888 RepID=A0BFB7_PARTE|nr:uncharacterized protein GSPATT00028269001 [Paramecium tetraurelia]CAK57234.1 unnamed protein product [Paramecium tetraurelia]|eukprot:XP_001424632.1 hypothetical protein (macronuclear) [Paramecium tetraurelia strain d4-2]
MGSTCCHKQLQVNQSQELVFDSNNISIIKKSNHKEESLNEPPLKLPSQSVSIPQVYEEVVVLSQLKIPIQNVKGAVVEENILKDSKESQEPLQQQDEIEEKKEDHAEQKDRVDFNQFEKIVKAEKLEIQNEAQQKQQQDTGTRKSPALSTKTVPRDPIDHSPSRKQSMASVGSVSVKIGVELFVNLKKQSITKVYTLGQVLGQGAFGKVWKVTHKTTGLIRAMKQIRKSELIKEDEQKMFSEMNLLKNLYHPNIVKLYELYQDSNNYYLITEYLSGGELFERIKKMNQFTEKRASDLMRQILMAIVYCHEKKIVHRDLKPENILFSGTEPDALLKIIDFGCSRRFNSQKNMTKRLGTPYYIAPEVLNHNYNEKCDVWSCGVILYILLCGYPPFTGKNENEIFEKVKTGKFKFPIEEWDSISREAKSLIQRMLQVDVASRYSASQALSDPWISKHSPDTQINKKVLENLGQFQAKSEFKAAIVQYIISQMTTNKELEDLQKSFQSLDKNKDGVLSKAELVEGYTKVLKNKEQAEEYVEKIISKIDKNQSGVIEFNEFLMAAINEEKILSIKKIEQAFKIFDSDGDGFISRQEIEEVMGELNADVWNLFLNETDGNNDGKISYEEFSKLILNK